MPSCPDCGRMNKDQVKFCVFCGAQLTRTQSAARNTLSTYLTVIGIALIFIGLIPLGLGGSGLYSADSLEQTSQGTILEDDPDTQRIIDNTRNMGVTELVIGILLVGIGLACIGYARFGFSILGMTPSAVNRHPKGKKPPQQEQAQDKSLLDSLLDADARNLLRSISPIEFPQQNKPMAKTAKSNSLTAVKKRPAMFCKGCGRRLEADWKVCPSCGLEIH